MNWKDLIAVFGIFVNVETSNYCMYDSFKPSQSIAASSCELVQTGQSLSKQCSPDDLATMVYPVQLDHKIFWLQKGDLCTAVTCEALILNSSDLFAPTSIFCLPCNDLNNFICDKNGSPCVPSTAAVSASKSTSCKEVWTRDESRLFLINNVRRTLADCHEWCTKKNGSSIDHEHELKFIENVPVPDPDVAFYWVAMAVKRNNGNALGTVLSTAKTRGIKLTQSFNIFDAGPGEKSNMYGCICIRKDRNYSTTTSTSMTAATSSKQTLKTRKSTTTTTTTSTTKTSTTTATTTTTTQVPSSSSTTQRSIQPGNILTGKYKNMHVYNGLMKKIGGATQIRAKRSSECAMECDRISGCSAYFFDKMTSSCQLVDGLNPNFDCDSVSTAKYYARQ